MEMEIKLDQAQYNRIDRFFTLYPAKAKRMFNAGFKETARQIVEEIRVERFLQTGPHSVGISDKNLANRIHLIEALQATVGFKGGEKKRVGGFVRIDYGDKKRSDSPAYIGRFHEDGTVHLPARAPLQSGLAPRVDRFQVVVDKILEKLLQE